ncbi:hypothetical protein R1sor_019656 [Riccia sorocarpa]|uniref:ACT domain-containing protein n=1 Tax=Riccia sorocarpa TaxID=122646 RepID=A0ABD3IEU8_9MARC
MTMKDYGEEFVSVRRGKGASEPSEITVNCPDKIGLGCDLARIVLEFGLTVVRGDLSTDGRWCFVVLWVLPRSTSLYGEVNWKLLKERLAAACPSHYGVLLPPEPVSDEPLLFLLQVSAVDRTGLLNLVTLKLWELELTIHKVKVSTSPEGKAVNLFLISDKSGRQPLDKERREFICEKVKISLGGGTLVQLMLAGPECGGLDCAPYLPASVSEDLFDEGFPKMTPKLPELDNDVSPVHTSIHIECPDRKGLFYDCMRTLKDNDIQVAFGRISTLEKGSSDINLFILKDGKKIEEPFKQDALRETLLRELTNPLRVAVVTRGPDTELLVAAPIEACGRGRPRVLFDVTHALLDKPFGICIFKADIGRHVVEKRAWEVYRFLLIEKPDLDLSDPKIRKDITEKVKKILLG